MSEFDNLPQALGEGTGFNTIEKKDTAFPDEKMSDLAALKVVIQDVEFAEKFINSKTLPALWNGADDLFRDYVPRKTWPNSKKQRSAIPTPVIMEAIETSLLPQAHMAFFSDVQPFQLDPVGKTTPDAARAMSHLVCWGIQETGFVEEIRKCLKSGFLYGTLVGKYGWTTSKHTQRTYKRGKDGKMEISEAQRLISRPTFEYVSLRNLLVAPHTNCQDIRTAKNVTHQKFIDAIELDALRADDSYKNVPTQAQLKDLLIARAEATQNSLNGIQYPTWRENQAERPTTQGSADPLKQPLELLEYWTDDRVITVLQRTIVIRNDENPFGKLPFLSCSFIDVLDSFYGFGVSNLLAGEQWLQQGVLNKWVDSLSLKLNPMWHRKKGAGTNTQNIQTSPGRVVNDDGDLAPLEIESISQEAQGAIEASESRAARRVGANFGPEMPNQAMRTAEGVNAFTSGGQTRLQYFIETFADLVFKPAIRAFIELIKDNIEEDDLKAILSDKDTALVLQMQAKDEGLLSVYNGQYSVDVLSSVKLAGRKAMGAMIQPLAQLLGQPAMQSSLSQQGKKFDYAEFLQQVFEITGWPGGPLIQDMSPEDMQRMQQNNPALVKAQADSAKTDQTHKNAQELQEQKTDGQAGVAVVRSILKSHHDADSAAATKDLALMPKPGGGQ